MTADAGYACASLLAALVVVGPAGAAASGEVGRLLPDKLSELAREELAVLANQVTLVVFTQEFECRSCGENTRLAREVGALSDKIKVEVFDFKRDKRAVEEYGIDKIPAIAVVGERDYGVRFFGVPGGYEFRAFLDAVKQVSKGESDLSEAGKIALKRVDRPVRVQVFVTPT